MENFQYCKRIGIIGGLGNEAMVDLIKKIATLPQAADCEYVIFGNSRMAYKPEEVGQHFLPDHPTELRRRDTARYTLQFMQHLEVDVVGLACNSAHQLFRTLLPELALHFVDMIRQTASALEGSRETILIMGVTSLLESRLYQDALAEQGVASTQCSRENQAKTMETIYNSSFGIKTAQVTPEAEQMLCQIITEEHRRQGVRHVVLGCTELPLALTPESCARFKKNGMLPKTVQVIDASMVLAESLIATTGSRSRLAKFSEKCRGSYTDWFKPLAIRAPSLSHITDAQERIFTRSRLFLAEQGKAITGSYSHLPTLFFLDSANDVHEKLCNMNISVSEAESLSDELIDQALRRCFFPAS